MQSEDNSATSLRHPHEEANTVGGMKYAGIGNDDIHIIDTEILPHCFLVQRFHDGGVRPDGRMKILEALIMYGFFLQGKSETSHHPTGYLVALPFQRSTFGVTVARRYFAFPARLQVSDHSKAVLASIRGD